MSEIADRLEMFASQLREAVDDGSSSPPHPWDLDDWLNDYRTWFESNGDNA